MKTEFESRISFSTYTNHRGKKCYAANVYWNGKLYETVKATKDLCVTELKRQADEK